MYTNYYTTVERNNHYERNAYKTMGQYIKSFRNRI